LPMRILGWCLMSNHFHLVLGPTPTETWVVGCSG
jgi:REP element-mobilizing transposase RayT